MLDKTVWYGMLWYECVLLPIFPWDVSIVLTQTEIDDRGDSRMNSKTSDLMSDKSLYHCLCSNIGNWYGFWPMCEPVNTG